MPAVGDLAPEIALPDETGTIHRLADQRGRWTILYFYPEDDTPGCTTEACEFRDRNDDDPRARRGRLGRQPGRRRAASARFREKFELPFTLLADEDHPVADAYGAWGEKQNYGKTYMGIIRSTVPDRPRRPDRPRLAEGQGRGPRGGGPRRRSTSSRRRGAS